MDLLDVLASPGKSLLDYASGGPSLNDYYRTLHDVYALLSEMHDEVITRLNKARLSTNLTKGKKEINELSQPDLLENGFRARELCDKLEERALELERSHAGAKAWEMGKLSSVLIKREHGAARFYVEELLPHLQHIQASPDLPSLRSRCIELRSTLLSQQAAFMAKADKALEMADD
jgi:hypothetical protein